MRLALATPLYPPDAGGPATYAKLLEEELPKRGWEVETVKFGDVKHLPKGIRHAVYAWHVFRAAQRADRVLALDPMSVGLPASIAARAAGTPLVVKIVGDYAWEQGTQRYGVTKLLDDFVAAPDKHEPFVVEALRRVQSRVARRAARIIVPSEYLKRIVMAWGAPADRIDVIYNAAPERVGHAKEPVTLPEGPYIVSMGRLVPWKGFDGVLRAFARARAHGFKLRLVIIGGGPERFRLESLARNLHLDSAVTFTGSLPHPQAAALLAGAKALVLNTGYEGLSHTILEAFQEGVPVLTTPAGGNPELVTDGVTGLLFPYRDEDAMAAALKRIETEPELGPALAAAAKGKLSAFTREALADRVAELLASDL